MDRLRLIVFLAILTSGSLILFTVRLQIDRVQFKPVHFLLTSPITSNTTIFPAPPFRHWPVNMSLFNGHDCRQWLSGDAVNTSVTQRLGLRDEDYFDPNEVSSCEEIHSRGPYYPDEPLSDEESRYPIAFANVIYRDYILLERILSSIYQPQNFYCYALDSKADSLFKARMRQLASCFPSNVMVLGEEFNTTSRGHNVIYAYLGCMKTLRQHAWKYLLLMNNQDVPLRTNAEIVRIAKLINGSNLVGAYKPESWSYNHDRNYTFANLHLYRNESRNLERTSNGELYTLRMAKSTAENFISRAFVEFILSEINVESFVNASEVGADYAVEENFIATLNSDDNLRIPGGFTHTCLDRGIPSRREPLETPSRYNVWTTTPNVECGRAGDTTRFRHRLCLFGLEDLHRLKLPSELVANKMWPERDYGAVSCWLEWLYNRTHFPKHYTQPLDEEYYARLPQVRFNRMSEREKERVRNANGTRECETLFKFVGLF